MSSPSPPAAGSPTRHSTRSPTTSMNMSTNTTSTTPSKIHPHGHHHHLPVGHATHSPAQSASGEAIQGRPSEAGGLHTSTSRGNILLPPSSMSASSSIPSTPADLLSVISSTTSNNQSPSSRPHSPSAPNSPVLLRSASSRPTSPRPSNHQDLDLNTTPQLDSSAVFERDVEFANDHLLTGSEAIDLAAAPVLSEVALSVASNESSPLESSGIIGGTGQASPFNIAQSLDSTLFPNTFPSPGLPSNAISDGRQDGYNNIPLSEQLRHSSSGGARPTSEGTGVWSSPPPSLSLSPSHAAGSPVSSSTPGSPIQSLYQSSSLVSAAAAGNHHNASSAGGSLFAHHISDGGAPVSGLDVGDGAGNAGIGYTSGNIVPGMPSPPGSAMSGVSLSGGQNDQSKRRLSMISYADIINSERLSDSHSGFSSPTPSSAMSLSAAALPVHTLHGSTISPALSPALSPGLAGIGAAGAGPSGVGGGVGSALYSPITSPEGEGALSPSVLSEGGLTRDSSSAGDGINTTSASSPTLPSFSKPENNRTETMSSVATERYYMPGQLPVYTPPISQSNQTEDKDVTPTNSSIKTVLESGKNNEEDGELKESTSSSSWNMMELGKALVGSAAGAVGSVLGVAGIGTEIDEDDGKKDDKDDKANKNGL